MLAIILIASLFGAGEFIVRTVLPEVSERPYADSMLGWTSIEFRELAPDAPAPGDTRVRLLALGDSYLALGRYQQKGRDMRFPAQLEQRMPDALVTRTLATQGWGTDQELIAYLEKGSSWHPDVVVLGFCANNDLLNILSTSHGQRTAKPYFRIEPDDSLALYDAQGRPLPIDFSHETSQVPLRSAFLDAVDVMITTLVAGARKQAATVDPRYELYDGTFDARLRMIEDRVRRLDFAPQDMVSETSAFVHEPGEIIRYQWALLERLLQALRDQVRADGARLVVMLLPTTFKSGDLDFLPGGSVEMSIETPDGPFTFRAAEPAERLAAICARLDVDCFDPVPGFAAEIERLGALEDVWPNPDDRHYSAVGQRILSHQLEAYLRDELHLLPQG